MMNRVLVMLATIATTLGTATAARPQTAVTSDQSPVRFQFEQTASPRGVAVEGYLRPRLGASAHVSPERSDIRQGDARSARAPGALTGTPAEE
jgi:hypothetical protein